MRSIARIFFLVILLFFVFQVNVFADDKFNTSYYVTYALNSSGLMNVTENFVITNKESNVYIKEQTVSYFGLNLGNVRVRDEQGEFEPKIESAGNQTKIVITFRDPKVGKGAVTKFSLIYQTSDLASQNGEVWQVMIPGIRSLEKYDEFNLELQLPQDFPEIQYVSIEPRTQWVWQKDEIADKGIFLIFGKEQFFSLTLDYSMKNQSAFAVLDSIAVPPATNYQNVFIKSVNFNPEYSKRDADGNWIFWYKLSPNETKKIRLTMLANILFDPLKLPALTEQEVKQDTAVQKYWDYENFSSNNEKIDALKTPEQIYDFVVSYLTYNYNRLSRAPERYTASEALRNPVNSICTDFTNLFIALARRAGIPAREVNGYAKTQNEALQPLSLEKDVLHAWPEYWDREKQTWIMVDPTWEKTTGGVDFFNKLDLNHVAFVVKGASSETPYPAGSYKTDDLAARDVKVDFESRGAWQAAQKLKGKIDLFWQVPEKIVSGIKPTAGIVLQNAGGGEVFDLGVVIKSNVPDLLPEKQVNIKRLIPFEKHEFALDLPNLKFYETKDVKIQVLINGKSFTKDIEYRPIWLWGNNLYMFGGSLILVVLTILLTINKIICSRRRKTIKST